MALVRNIAFMIGVLLITFMFLIMNMQDSHDTSTDKIRYLKITNKSAKIAN
jgi:hypothetical protein